MLAEPRPQGVVSKVFQQGVASLPQTTTKNKQKPQPFGWGF
jgi:hypothetical protein